MTRELLITTLTIFFTTAIFAQIDLDRSVQITASFDSSINSTILEWDARPATVHRVSRWHPNGFWAIESNVPDSVTSYTIPHNTVGNAVEYRIERIGTTAGYGYIYTGKESPAVHHRGQCLLIVDSVLSDALPTEIQRWATDVQGDGWNVEIFSTPSSSSVTEIKDYINSWYDPTDGDHSTIFILGDIAVPYSGEINPDGHDNHVGAWPCDGFYGDIDDHLWTDVSVNNTTASDNRNRNIPGDGKYDQSIFPSTLEIEVGRADLSNLPAFSEDYVELSRQYLEKNHQFRNGQIDLPRRGLIENNFGSYNEGFAQSGWKNFTPMFGAENVKRGDYEVDLENDAYLWAYACGGGSYTSMGGVGTTTNLYVERELQTAFVMNFGSYFGDWDKTNNLLRASLGSGHILANAWAGRPNWQFHHMALGKHIGYSTLLAQNNLSNYVPGYGAKFTHIALIGDPTLRMHPVKPAQELKITEDQTQIELSWTPSTDVVLGYYIYRKADDSPWTLLNAQYQSEATYVDQCFEANTEYSYMVRAVKLESSASGTYYNLSTGIQNAIITQFGTIEKADFTYTSNYEEVFFEQNNSSVDSVVWEFSDGVTTSESSPNHIFPSGGVWVACMTTYSQCGTSTLCDTLVLESSLPDIDSVDVSILHNLCPDLAEGAIYITISDPPGPYTYIWSFKDTTTMGSALNLPKGQYGVIIVSSTGKSITINDIFVDAPDPFVVNITTTPSSGNNGTATADISGGTEPYNLRWSHDPNMLPPGKHTLTITDINNCVTIVEFEVPFGTSTDNLAQNNGFDIFPNPTSNVITISHPHQSFDILGIYDLNGRQMECSRIDETNETVIIDVNALIPAPYIIRIKMGNELLTALIHKM